LIDPPIGIFTVTPLDAERELLVGSGAFSPEWSPDGETVAFGRLDYDGAFPWSFLQVPAAGGQPTPMRGVAEEAALYGFDWSPDGTGVVFGGPDGIVVANADGSDAVLVASHNDVLQAQNPRWSPDGRLVLYEMSAVNVGIFVHVVGSDGTGAYLVSEASGGGALGADWEPILARLP
jgi:Tol biopolymer transport system component